jgi:hypothetical protein
MIIPAILAALIQERFAASYVDAYWRVNRGHYVIGYAR